jgi:transcriptional regulator with XRE-family HTH domain
MEQGAAQAELAAFCMEGIDVRRLRGLLAESQITHTALARAAKLSVPYVSSILRGKVYPGELATIKLERG